MPRDKEKQKEYNKKHRQTETYKKSNRMSNWRQRGVKNVNDEMYDHYMSCDKCEVCKCEFTKQNWKCLDHDHTTGEFRFVLCNRCNCFDNWVNVF